MERYQLTRQEQVFFESLPQAFAVYQFVNKRVVTLALSDGFCRLFGYDDREQAVYDMDNDMYQDTHPDDVRRIADAAVRFATEGGEYEAVYRVKVRGGDDYRVIHANGAHVYTDTGVCLAHVWYTDEGIWSDGPEDDGSRIGLAMKSALHEDSILKENRYDHLTGLPNLSYFFELAEAGKQAIHRNGDHAVLLYLDLNGMKYYNYRNGFAEGDKLLHGIARLLVKYFSNENCCHIGADRFTAYTADRNMEDTLGELFREAAKINGGKSLPVRVGIYSSAFEDVPASSAYDRAKIACDGLRKSGASAFNYYTEDMGRAFRHRQYIREHIDQAIAEKWITVYYQPIIRAVNGRVCEEEALARWIDPAEGFLSPAEFIPELEESGLIYKLDLYVLERVIEKIRSQQEKRLHIVPHSINLSRSDFDACDIAEEIRSRVDAAGIPRKMITIEITESMIGSDPEFMKQQVERFRAMGFPVWMDDFGSGYSSLDVLQTITFDLIKFDMSFMRKLDEGEKGRILLTELMKMASALGVDTVCEGVETEEQTRFLQEIGCSKLQGFHFCKPIPYEQILERYRQGKQIGFEDPDTSAYYEAIGRINLYDMDVIAGSEEDSFHNTFNSLPMSILEIRGDSARFVRSNPSYRDFMHRFFGANLDMQQDRFRKYNAAFMHNVVRTCCEQGRRAFFDEKMPDGSVVHSFARRIGINPLTGTTAIVIAVLSITDPQESATYAEIVMALAADYYNIYVVDLDTENFIEYSSQAGRDELTVERHGTNFFESARQDTMTRIYEEDREPFLALFTREKILGELDEKGVSTAVYRLTDSGEPVYVNMKITRTPDKKRIILGVSEIDSLMQQRRQAEDAKRDRDALARVMAITEDYMALYSIHPETGEYLEYTASEEYQSLGLIREGDDFFEQCAAQGKRVVCPEDLPEYLNRIKRETILDEIRRNGSFMHHYRLMIDGEPKQVTLKIVPFGKGNENRLFAGVRAWRTRN